jgi:AAA+ superfamily predicted ATPase
MQPTDAILESFEEGHAALLLTGRSLFDLVVTEGSKLRPLVEDLRNQIERRYGMVLITYSMANGIEWDGSLSDERDRLTVDQALHAHRLVDISQDANEVARVIRGVSSLSRSPAEGLKWSDQRPMRFAFLLFFGEHLTPGSMTNGTQTDNQLVATELAHLTAQSLALRSSGNLVLFHAREGMLDPLVSSVLYRIRLPLPDQAEKTLFLDAAVKLYSSVRFEEPLTRETIVNLNTNTPNRGLETLLRTSHRTGRSVTAQQLTAQKERDVEEVSEGTLSVLDATRVRGVELAGLNIAAPIRVLDQQAEALLRVDPSAHATILIAGPPGSGKTDLATRAAWKARASAYRLVSPKHGIVGETERRSRLQWTVLRELSPAVAFADEVTEMLPLQRQEHDGDSGASRAVMAELLNALSDETRRGKSLFLASTNVPWRMSAAMRSRFATLPVLHPLRRDFAAILVTTAKRIDPTSQLDPADPKIEQAAGLFYEKGANARHMRAALSNAKSIHSELNPETILFAAEDLCGVTDFTSLMFADLWAVRSCSFKSWLPWFSQDEYPFPHHLAGLVDAQGNIKVGELEKRMEELRPRANV